MFPNTPPDLSTRCNTVSKPRTHLCLCVCVSACPAQRPLPAPRSLLVSRFLASDCSSLQNVSRSLLGMAGGRGVGVSLVSVHKCLWYFFSIYRCELVIWALGWNPESSHFPCQGCRSNPSPPYSSFVRTFLFFAPVATLCAWRDRLHPLPSTSLFVDALSPGPHTCLRVLDACAPVRSGGSVAAGTSWS